MRDIVLNDDFDLQFTAGGDLAVGQSTTQHKRCLIVANKGDYRQFPWVGVGISRYLLDDQFGDVQQEIQKQFELDGMVIKELRINERGEIIENAEYL